MFQIMALNGTRCPQGEAWTLGNLRLVKVPMERGKYTGRVGPSCEVCSASAVLAFCGVW